MAEIENSLRNSIIKFSKYLAQRFSVMNVYLYGSYAVGDYDEWSDIDLAVVLDEEVSHSREIFSLAKDFDLRFDALGFTCNDFTNSLLPIIPEIKNKGIQIL